MQKDIAEILTIYSCQKILSEDSQMFLKLFYFYEKVI